MDSVSDENVIKLQKQEGGLQQEYDMLNSSTDKSLWLNDLDALEPFL